MANATQYLVENYYQLGAILCAYLSDTPTRGSYRVRVIAANKHRQCGKSLRVLFDPVAFLNQAFMDDVTSAIYSTPRHVERKVYVTQENWGTYSTRRYVQLTSPPEVGIYRVPLGSPHYFALVMVSPPAACALI
jgi:hypothetical protein